VLFENRTGKPVIVPVSVIEREHHGGTRPVRIGKKLRQVFKSDGNMPVGLQAGNACIEEFGRDRQMGCRIETLARRRPDMMQCEDRTQAAGAGHQPGF
jgi:hypothetical protein